MALSTSSLPLSHRLDRRRRAAWALGWIAIGLLLYVPFQFLALRSHKARARQIPMMYCRLICRVLGIQVEVIGKPARSHSTLFVANHISWADIPTLGSEITGSFVAKSDVEQMRVVGMLADLYGTIYVDRERRNSTHAQRTEIAQRLSEGENVILFPEGTTTAGRTVGRFKSALFAAAETHDGTDVLIQPVTLAYTHINGLPVLRTTRYKLSWIGDMELFPHLLDLVALGSVRACIQYHEPIRPSDFSSRKELARYCEQVISKGLSQATRDHA